MYLTREEVSRPINFASAGQGPGAPIVLSTNDLSFNEAPGMRLMGAILMGPGANLEGGYFDLFEWDTSAVVADPAGGLFSAIGDFGQVAGAPNLPELINSNFQSIHYQTELHNWELNYRRRWVSPNCRFHSSWLIGVRYLVLNEDLNYHINREDPVGAVGRVVGNVDNTISIFNDVVGFTTGGDLLLCVIPRVKVGANLKATLGGVRAENHTVVRITRLTGPPPAPGVQTFDELAGKEDVAFVGEGGIEGIFEATERITLRAGYQLLYVDGIALAPENFNTNPFLTTREPVLNDNGDVFYHGFQAGFEFTW
jgi:hypothetical protein